MSFKKTGAILREPQQERTRRLVENICSATVQLVLEKGVRAVNTNAIAKHAGIDISSRDRVFRNKEAILVYIAERWLTDIRQVYDRFRSDPELLSLPWRPYFQHLLYNWRLPSQDELYACMIGVWNYFPDLEKLDEYQRAYHVTFFLEQFERFGARGSRKEWELLATYLYHVEDAVHEAAGIFNPEDGEAIRNIYYESFFQQVGRFLDGAK